MAATSQPPATTERNHWVGSRGRRILHTGMWSFIAKGCAAANLFISVPFVLRSLGPEQFGAWATLVSLVTFAGFLDFGFGNGTMNLVAAANGRQSRDEVATILQESRRALVGVAFCLTPIAALATLLVPWNYMLGMHTAATDGRIAAAIVLFSVIFAVPLNLANRVQLGLGRGDRAFRWQAAGQLTALAGVVAFATAHASLSVLTAVSVGTPLLASLANTYSLSKDSDLIVTTQASSQERSVIGRKIRHEGFMFFVLQLAAALAFSADLPLISIFRGATEAGTYAIAQRLFSVIPLTLSLLWAPLWPIYRQALAAGDHAWVISTLRRSLLLAVAFAATGSTILALGFGSIVGLWVHHPIAVAGIMLAGFVCWCIMEASGTAIATFLNAASVMRYQLITSCVFATLCVGGKVWVVAHLGINWMPWVTVTTYCAASVFPLLWFRKRVFSGVFSRKY
jgi:O-antigen/teichoic acid export membrane protein